MRLVLMLWRQLRRDQRGGLIAAEYLLIGTLLTIGLLAGIGGVQEALLEQLEYLADLIMPDEGGSNVGFEDIEFENTPY